MAKIDKKALFQKFQLKVKKVDIGDNDFVFISQLSVERMQSLNAYVQKLPALENDSDKKYLAFMGGLVTLCLCDELGHFICDVDDIPTILQKMTSDILFSLNESCAELNHMNATEDTIKNSETTQIEDLNSVCVECSE